MLRACPKSLFSWDFDIYDDEEFVAFLDLAWFRERGELSLEGATYEIGREGVMSGEFFLARDGVTLASATKPSAMFRSFEVVVGTRIFTLEAASPLTRKFKLYERGEVVGSVYPMHLFTREAVVRLPEDLPMPVKAFIIWLVIILWKREQSAAAGT